MVSPISYVAIERSDMESIALLWLVEGLNDSEIAREVGLSIDLVNKARRGQRDAMLWADVVGDLILAGFDLSRGHDIRKAQQDKLSQDAADRKARRIKHYNRSRRTLAAARRDSE
jgi:hypothetical protein